MSCKIAFLVSFLSLQVCVAQAAIIYVKPGGSGGGTSWSAAYGNLQTALHAANAGDQVWVANGVFTPSPSSPDSSFYLRNGVAVYGGFAGTETTLTARADTTGAGTVLSGNLGGGVHSRHVVYSTAAIDGTSRLDGFTISDGKLDLTGMALTDGGAGMYNAGSPYLANLIFRNDTVRIIYTVSTTVEAGGGGLYTTGGSPVLRNLTFIANGVSQVMIGTLGMGGTGAGGGGLFINGGTVRVESCYFDRNVVSGVICRGGGLKVAGSGTKEIINCLFTHNIAPNGGYGGEGGGLCAGAGTTVTNCTFANNGDFTIWNTNGLILQNSIVYGSPSVYSTYTPFGSLTTNYCMMSGSYPGTGNINIAGGGYPRFVDTVSGNYSLSGCSLGVNAGNSSLVTTTTDLAGKPRLYGPVDMGAFEYQRGSVPDTVYVSASTGHTCAGGLSWSDPFSNLQNALRYSCPTGAPRNVWVAAGTYVPTAITTDRVANFSLVRPGLKVYGGFAGTETMLNARDSTGHYNVSVLSGEIQNDGNAYNNSFRVVFADADSASELNSFTITRGAGNDPGMNIAYSSGGGILNMGGASTFANLILRENHAGWGGGFANYDGAPTLRDVVFLNDTSPTGGGFYNDGGGFVTALPWVTPYGIPGNARLINDSFIQCYSSFAGGGIFNIDANPTIDGSVFYKNSAMNYGGGIESDNGELVIRHTKFIENFNRDTITGRGGALGLSSTDAGTITLYDVLFSKNKSAPGGAISASLAGASKLELNNVTFSGNLNLAHTSPLGTGGNSLFIAIGIAKVRNCIFDSTGNGNNAISGMLTQCDIRSSLLPGAFPSGALDSGSNILNADAMFIDTAAGDYRLLAGSPAINAGNSAYSGGISMDLGMNPRISGSAIDIGAYEYCASLAAFTSSGVDTVSFTYTGSASYDSVLWSFGDGTTSTAIGPTHIFAPGATYTVCLTVYTVCGRDTQCVVLTLPESGVSSLHHASDPVVVYPNPAGDVLFVKYAGKGSHYRLLNLMGQELRCGTINADSEAIPLMGNSVPMPPGFYVLQLTEPEGKTQSLRILKL